jgi:hypothetical protein
MVAQSKARNTVAALGVGAALLACLAKAGPATDPCTLLAASEAQTYVGVLSTAPFRASDGAANPKGTQCVYRGSGGRQIAIDWNAEGAGQAGKIVDSVPNIVGARSSKPVSPASRRMRTG